MAAIVVHGSPELTLLAFVTSLGLLAYGLAHRRWSRWAGCLICLFAAYMALKHIRHGAIYGTLWIGFVPSWLSPTPLGRQCVRWGMQSRQFLLRGAFLLTIVAMVFSLYHRAFSITVPSSLQESPHCYPWPLWISREREESRKHLVPFHAGSYVSWRLFPAMRVSVDGRYEVAYQEEVLPNHNVFFRAEPGWENVIERYRPDYLLVPSQSPVMHALQQSDSQWRILYQDTSYCLFEPVSNLDRGRPLTMLSSSTAFDDKTRFFWEFELPKKEETVRGTSPLTLRSHRIVPSHQSQVSTDGPHFCLIAKWRSSQSKKTRLQRTPFCGLVIQCPSSGK